MWEQSRKGKQRACDVSDSDLALEACRHELEAMAMLISDRTLGLSIAQAVDSDACAIAEVKAAEKQAIRDRDFAITLSQDLYAKPAPVRPKDKKKE